MNNYGKCTVCLSYYCFRDNLCSQCYQKLIEIPQYSNSPFSIQIYDSIATPEIRKMYFKKYANNFWGYFCSITGVKHNLITDLGHLKLTLMGLTKVSHNGKIFLMSNGFCNGSANMTTADLMARAIKEIGIYVANFTHIIGQMLIDPWNMKDPEILKIYGNSGNIPSVTNDLMKLYIDNKTKAQQSVEKLSVSRCKCGYNIQLDEIDISKAPNFVSKKHTVCNTSPSIFTPNQLVTPVFSFDTNTPSMFSFNANTPSMFSFNANTPSMFSFNANTNTNFSFQNINKKAYIWNPYADDPMDESYP
jgi:hypothetical protein